MGYIQKALEKAIWNTLGLHAVLTTFGRCLCCLLPLFINMQLPCLHTNSRPVLLPPPMHHKKPLVRKRPRSGDANWVKVTRPEPEPGGILKRTDFGM